MAAFIGEPIMGAGGVLMPPESYWPEVQRICRKYDVLLVADEVICGFGRTGHMFGSERFGIEPDMMTLAKGITSGYLPLSAVMVSAHIAGKLIEQGGEFAHGYTYSGHPAACAVALANISLLEQEDLVRRTHEETGPHLKARLQELLDHPLVGEVRSEGLIGAVELVKDKQARSRWDDKSTAGQICRDHCFASNIILRAVRDTMVFSPPLIIEMSQIDQLVDGLRASLDRTAAELGRA
ncbi:aminotransferase class III-fold pyridoxal phosphate-dependent enzyme [Fodinicurvata halophila]|uniref:aminotransferase class III-fold pyridoxal phosphate-dependent enzyme n=1 Tax=Fodinicurvata halophila TaxID=1419723 RepID=UPI0036297A6E